MVAKLKQHAATPDQPSGWDTIRAHLMARKRAVYAELLAYPRQIAGCDIQFQLLSEKRDALIAELARLDAARDAAQGEGGDSNAALTAFIESAPDLDAPHP